MLSVPSQTTHPDPSHLHPSLPSRLEFGEAKLPSSHGNASPSSITDTPWLHAYNLWLSSRHSPNTCRAYAKAWSLFSSFTQKPPHLTSRPDVASWVDSLRSSGLSSEFIHQRLAAISSFYTYTSRTYALTDPAGHERPLHSFNPAAAISLPKAHPYRKSTYLTTAQARAFLNAIPRHTLQGKRDYALANDSLSEREQSGTCMLNNSL